MSTWALQKAASAGASYRPNTPPSVQARIIACLNHCQLAVIAKLWDTRQVQIIIFGAGGVGQAIHKCVCRVKCAGSKRETTNLQCRQSLLKSSAVMSSELETYNFQLLFGIDTRELGISSRGWNHHDQVSLFSHFAVGDPWVETAITKICWSSLHFKGSVNRCTGLRSASEVASITCAFTYRRQVTTGESWHEL